MYHSLQEAKNKGADQTVRMRRPACAFVVRMQQSQVFSHCCTSYISVALCCLTENTDKQHDYKSLPFCSTKNVIFF